MLTIVYHVMCKESQKRIEEKSGIRPLFKPSREISPNSDQTKNFCYCKWVNQIGGVAHVYEKSSNHPMIKKVIIDGKKHNRRQDYGYSIENNLFRFHTILMK